MIEKEYIEMCRSGEEIQEQWEPKEGDFTYQYYSEENKKFSKEHWPHKEDHNGFFCHVMDSVSLMSQENRMEAYKERGFWIPRQEDLQAIYIDTEKINWQKAFIKFKDWVILTVIVDRNEFNRINSLTTLWLHFIMESCYGKRYDQEKKCWVRI